MEEGRNDGIRGENEGKLVRKWTEGCTDRPTNDGREDWESEGGWAERGWEEEGRKWERKKGGREKYC